MTTTLDNLRRAALDYADAYRSHSGLVTFVGTGPTIKRTQAELARATRQLVQASDLHAVRTNETLSDLILAGHTIHSAQRLRAVRKDRIETAPRRKYKQPKATR